MNLRASVEWIHKVNDLVRVQRVSARRRHLHTAASALPTSPRPVLQLLLELVGKHPLRGRKRESYCRALL